MYTVRYPPPHLFLNIAASTYRISGPDRHIGQIDSQMIGTAPLEPRCFGLKHRGFLEVVKT